MTSILTAVYNFLSGGTSGERKRRREDSENFDRISETPFKKSRTTSPYFSESEQQAAPQQSSWFWSLTSISKIADWFRTTPQQRAWRSLFKFVQPSVITSPDANCVQFVDSHMPYGSRYKAQNGRRTKTREERYYQGKPSQNGLTESDEPELIDLVDTDDDSSVILLDQGEPERKSFNDDFGPLVSPTGSEVSNKSVDSTRLDKNGYLNSSRVLLSTHRRWDRPPPVTTWSSMEPSPYRARSARSPVRSPASRGSSLDRNYSPLGSSIYEARRMSRSERKLNRRHTYIDSIRLEERDQYQEIITALSNASASPGSLPPARTRSGLTHDIAPCSSNSLAMTPQKSPLDMSPIPSGTIEAGFSLESKLHSAKKSLQNLSRVFDQSKSVHSTKEVTRKPKDSGSEELRKSSSQDSRLSKADTSSSSSHHCSFFDKNVVERLNYELTTFPSIYREKFSNSTLERRKYATEYELEAKIIAEDREKRRHASVEDDIREKFRLMGILLPERPDEEEVEEPAIPELSPDQESIVDGIFNRGPPDEIIVDAFNIPIKRRDLLTLSGLNWLNDEVMNFYYNLLMDRCSSPAGKERNLPNVYVFNTFFYPRILQSGHAGVKRWTKKVDLFSFDVLLIPIHLGVHWCLATVDFEAKLVLYYDSMGGENQQCLTKLKEYLVTESMDKRKIPFDLNGWKFEIAKDIPRQLNGSDCGVFSCKFAEYASRRAPISFEQEHMPIFRRQMVYEICTKQLLN